LLAAKGGKLKRQIATNSLPPFAAFGRSVSSRLFSQRTREGMVSTKITGFPIPESRQKSRLIERIKLNEDGRSEGPLLKLERT
jgi:hypothetical protein